MDFRNLTAAQAYSTTQTVARPEAKEAVQPPPGEAFSDVAQSFAQALKQSEQVAQAAMVGGADPHSLVQALAQAELAVEAAVTVRDKVVEAYQEILRMPV